MQDEGTQLLVYHIHEACAFFQTGALSTSVYPRNQQSHFYVDVYASRLAEYVDFIVCLGGDGVILHASHLFRHNIPPVSTAHCKPSQCNRDDAGSMIRVQ
jgi:NAD kinase